MNYKKHLHIELNEVLWTGSDPAKKHWKYPPVKSSYKQSEIPLWWNPKKVVGREYTFKFYQTDQHINDNILVYNDGDDTYQYAKFNSKKELLDWIEIAKLAETANDMWAWMSTIKFGYLYNGEIYDY